MNAQSLTSLFNYHFWANHRVWDCLEGASPEQFTEDVAYSHGSLQSQFFHLMQTDAFPLQMVGKPVPGGKMQKEDFLDKAVMRARWDDVETAVQEAMREWTDEQLQAPFSMPTPDGETVDASLWEVLMTLVNHGTNHRAQILMQLHKLGAPTVEQGLYYYILENR